MSRRRAAAAGMVAALGVTGVLLVTGRDAGAGPGDLAWAGKTTTIRPPELPRDRIVTGRVRNRSGDAVELDAAEVSVRDASGRRLRTAARFLAGFAHGLHPPPQRPERVSDFERTRLGEIATLKPGRSVPLTVAWRERRGAGRAAEIALGEGGATLPVR